MTTPDSITQKVSADFSWLTHHLVMLAIVGVLVFAGVYGIESVIARHDHDNAVEKQTIAQTLAQQNQTFQAQTQTQINALVQQNAALSQQVGALATAITSRDSQLRAQQNQVPALTPDQLSVEWQKGIKNAGNIKPILGGYQIDQAAAVASVQAIESVPVLRMDITDLQKSNLSLQSELNNDAAVLIMEKKSHLSDNASNQALIDAQNAKIKDITAQCRKSKLKWFGLGFLAGLFAAHSAGI